MLVYDRGNLLTALTATYVGEKGVEAQQSAPPDPGAMAAAIFLKGLRDGLGAA